MTDSERIAILERQLALYHERLEEVIAQRNRVAIDAAWGVADNLASLINLGTLGAVIHFGIGWDGWAGFAIMALGGITVLVLTSMRFNTKRMAEIDALPPFPKWSAD